MPLDHAPTGRGGTLQSGRLPTGRTIAVLVHNDVLKDARVLKQVQTLGRAGHQVDVVGAAARPGVYPATVSGARSLTIVDIAPDTLRSRAYALAETIYPVATDYLLALGAVLPLFFVAALPKTLTALALAIAVVSPLLMLSLLSIRARLPRRRRSIVTLGLVAIVALAMVVAVAAGRLGLGGFVALFSILFLSWRLDVNLRRLAVRQIETLRARRMRRHRRERYSAIADRLAAQVDPARHDTVHCHDIIALIAGTRLKARHPTLHVIWDAHELYEDVASGTEDDRLHVREIIRAAEGRIDAFVTISESFRDFYGTNYPGLPPARIVMNATREVGPVVYDGRLHRAAGLAPGRHILLFQGGFAPHRGIGHLLAAAERLPDRWSIVMMGWGKLEADIRAAIDRLADADDLANAPLAMIPAAPQDELPFWTAGATLGVIPYENVGMNHLYCTPNKLWEYPNAGVPILATALIEMERMIATWGTGLLLPRDFTPDDIVAALAGATPEGLATLRANCARFSAEMSWARFEPELMAAYPS